jgi:thiol-disulfide isomerase/thioredoxin
LDGFQGLFYFEEESMGQYYLTVNLDKRQYLHPHAFGDGLKLLEFGACACGTLTALSILLSDGNGRGCGDLHVPEDHPLAELVSSWCGDRIVVAGDYADDGHFLTEEQIEAFKKDYPLESERLSEYGRQAPTLYEYAKRYFEDISEKVMQLMGCDGLLRRELIERISYRDNERLPDFLKNWKKELVSKKGKTRDNNESGKGTSVSLRPDMVLTVPEKDKKQKKGR